MIIVPRQGTLVAVRSEKATPGFLTVEGLKDTSQDILLTSFTQKAQVAHQVVQTIGGPEYLYVFGDMLQDLQVGVVVYAKSCEGSTAASYLKSWEYYTKNRLQPGKVQRLSISFAGVNLQGLLVGFSTQASVGGGFSVIQGTLSLRGWHVTASNGSNGASGTAPSSAGGGGGGPEPFARNDTTNGPIVTLSGMRNSPPPSAAAQVSAVNEQITRGLAGTRP
jgi:hypothetical protein